MSDEKAKYFQPYLPDIVLDRISGKKKNNTEETIEGALLFADLSGFTALSEKLGELGRIGAEKLASIINDCFDPLLEIVYRYNGDVLRFGGDAFLVLFEGENRVDRAYKCATVLIEWVKSYGRISSPAGDVTLGIHAGISDGAIFYLTMGDKRSEYLICGKSVEDVYAAADMAEFGQLVIAANAPEILPFKTKTISGDFHLCEITAPGTGGKTVSNSERITELSGIYDEISNFIPEELKSKLIFNNGTIEGEHRRLTSLFIGIDSLRKNLESDFNKSVGSIRRYFGRINDIIGKYGGFPARIDSCGDSERILAFFGAPLCHGHDEQNCLRAILEIETAKNDINGGFMFPIRHKYGVNSGICFVGDVGGKVRREYTGMGDAINLAARLMSKASFGKVLVGEDTAKICRDEFKFKAMGNTAVKGKKKPVKIFELSQEYSRKRLSRNIIGRDEELRKTAEFVGNIKSGVRSIMMITGEPGAGKSLLGERIRHNAIEKAIKIVEGTCYKHSINTPYGLIKSILLELLGLTEKTPQKNRRAVLRRMLGEMADSEWEPLIAPLLDYYPPVPPQIRNLPEDSKKNKINDIILKLVRDELGEKGYILLIDDIQWIDDTSFVIMELLIRSGSHPGMLLIGRPGDIFDRFKTLSEDIVHINLGPLAPPSARELFLSILHDDIPGEEIILNVIEKSGGNPFYLEEMAKALLELGEDKFDSPENIPSGIESVITARIDNLNDMARKTIRTASVIGRIFGYNVLKEILPNRNMTGKLRQYLDELAHLDLTPVERIQPVLEYIFKHILTQEVAYNGLPFSSRESLHLKIANYYSSRERIAKRQPEIIAHHYIMGNAEIEALPFLLKAGNKAASEFANKEAFDFYAQALDISEKLDQTQFARETLISRGSLAKRTANYSQAESDYIKLKSLAENDQAVRSLAARELSFIYRMIGNYDRAGEEIDILIRLSGEDREINVFCLNGKAEIARRTGGLQQCRELLLQALDIMNKRPVAGDLAAQVYNNLGICHWSLGKLKEAHVYYKTALKHYRTLKDLGGQSKIINNIGIINDELGKLEHAAKSYEKAEMIFKRIGESRSEAYACANLGTNFISRGYLSRALDKLSVAIEIFRNIGDMHSLAYATGDLGFASYCTGNIKNASVYLDEAIERAGVLEDDELTLESEIRRSRINIHSNSITVETIDEFVKKGSELGSVELEIKAILLKLFKQILNKDINGALITLNDLNLKAELSNYPELIIERDIQKMLYEYLSGNEIESRRLFKGIMKNAVSRDLGLKITDLYICGKAIGIYDLMPENAKDKVCNYVSRADSGLNAIERESRQRLMEDSINKMKQRLLPAVESHPANKTR